MDPDRDQLLTLAEASKVFCISPSWLKARAENAEISHLRIGRLIYFARNALEESLVELASTPVPVRGASP